MATIIPELATFVKSMQLLKCQPILNHPLHYNDSVNHGSGLLTGMVNAIGGKAGANIFVAGHSKGASVVKRVQDSSANQHITAGAVLALPFLERGEAPPNQLRVNPKADIATDPFTPGGGPGFWDKDKSRKYGHESVLSVDYARYIVVPYFRSRM